MRVYPLWRNVQHDLVAHGNAAFFLHPGHQPALVARKFRELPAFARMMYLDDICHLPAWRILAIDDQRRAGVDQAVEQYGELLADGKTKAGTAVTPVGGAIRLFEGIEDMLLLGEGYTYTGVLHADLQLPVTRLRLIDPFQPQDTVF